MRDAVAMGYPGLVPDAGPTRFVLGADPAVDVWVMNFGLACCAVEFVAASMSRPDVLRDGGQEMTASAGAAVLVVSGTVTDKMAPAILRAYEQLPEPRYVVSFGSCANCGGPYWDSYCVTKGVDQIIPVDVYVPGCPPRPEALLAALAQLQDTITAASA
jgi:NADH-quinone oxidoreductase subunit B